MKNQRGNTWFQTKTPIFLYVGLIKLKHAFLIFRYIWKLLRSNHTILFPLLLSSFSFSSLSYNRGNALHPWIMVSKVGSNVFDQEIFFRKNSNKRQNCSWRQNNHHLDFCQHRRQMYRLLFHEGVRTSIYFTWHKKKNKIRCTYVAYPSEVTITKSGMWMAGHGPGYSSSWD